MFPFIDDRLYYIAGALQLICIIHCWRTGNQNKWFYLIIFLPFIGSIAYIATEILTRHQVQKVQSGLGALINPAGSVRKLEENLRFSDTFNNRIALADAYLATGQTDRAVELYEKSYTGAFTENEHLLRQLMIAYFQQQRYEKVLPFARKLYSTPPFARSAAHLLYAMALEKNGQPEQAEKEFALMNTRYAHFEARYQYGLFLLRSDRMKEAQDIFSSMVEEGGHLSHRERTSNQVWIAKAKEELRAMR